VRMTVLPAMAGSTWTIIGVVAAGSSTSTWCASHLLAILTPEPHEEKRRRRQVLPDKHKYQGDACGFESRRWLWIFFWPGPRKGTEALNLGRVGSTPALAARKGRRCSTGRAPPS
jgi:hypothetical protein